MHVYDNDCDPSTKSNTILLCGELVFCSCFHAVNQPLQRDSRNKTTRNLKLSLHNCNSSSSFYLLYYAICFIFSDALFKHTRNLLNQVFGLLQSQISKSSDFFNHLNFCCCVELLQLHIKGCFLLLFFNLRSIGSSLSSLGTQVHALCWNWLQFWML